MWSEEEERQLEKYGVCFDWLSEVSDAALKREQQAKAHFHRAKKDFECTTLAALSKGEKHVIEDVVPPSCHLTKYTWKTFKTWIEDHHPGWKAKRRVVSENEIKEYEAENEGIRCPSRGKSYYISFNYQDPSTLKKKASTTKSCDGDANTEAEEAHQPPAKKLKSEPIVHFNFEGLPEVMQTHVLSFCDVPTLGALLPMSKTLCRIVKQDYLWEPHLKLLLHELFDDSLVFSQSFFSFLSAQSLVSDPATPLTEREDWRQSTALYRWWQEPRDNLSYRKLQKKTVMFLADKDLRMHVSRQECQAKRRRPARLFAASKPAADSGKYFDFLFSDVPLREYYHRVGNMACQAIRKSHSRNECNQYCRDCASKTWEQPTEFRNLPKIMWFF